MMVLCQNKDCGNNLEGACKLEKIELDGVGSCLSEVKKEKPKQDYKPLSGVSICLDAGHYGKYNRCPIIPEYYESDMAWKLTMLQKKYLEEMGARVVLTRISQNVDKDLRARGTASIGCDLFLSNHSNAVSNSMNETIDYVAAYHLVNDITTQADDISAEIAKLLAPAIAGTMGTAQGYKVLTRKSSNDRNKDGMMNDNYYGVLNGARAVNVPGLILEHGFHTNSKTVRWLLKDSNLDRLAMTEANVIAVYFSEKKGAAKPEEPKTGVPFLIKVANVPEGDVLNIRKEPNHKSESLGYLQWNDHNLYTIVEEKNGWGKLKSGLGWICLKYTERY